MAEVFAETAPAVKDSTDGSSSIESFDDTEVVEVPDSPQSGDPTPTKQDPKLKEVKQTDSLEDQEDEQESTEKEPKEAKDEERAETRETEEAPKTKGSVKGRVDGKMVNLDGDMEVRVKVDGKFQNVSLADLRDGYSSNTHVTEKLDELRDREQTVQQELDDYVEERDEIQHHFKEIRDKLDDPEGNPMDALYYLLDMTGRNRNDYYKKILAHHLEEVEELQLMDEPERRAYFLERENEYLKTRHESSNTEARRMEEEEAFINNLTEMREARDVSEEEFVGAYNQLLDLGETKEQLTADVVMDYACIYPAVEAAEEILESFDPELVDDDEIVQEIAEALIEDPTIEDEEVIEVLIENFGAPAAVHQVNRKLGPESYYQPKKATKRDDSDKPESFDDFDHYGGR